MSKAHSLGGVLSLLYHCLSESVEIPESLVPLPTHTPHHSLQSPHLPLQLLQLPGSQPLPRPTGRRRTCRQLLVEELRHRQSTAEVRGRLLEGVKISCLAGHLIWKKRRKKRILYFFTPQPTINKDKL